MAALAQRAERIAARLREAGCRPGDRVAVLGRPSLAWTDVMLGAMFARCGFAPLSTSLTVNEQRLLLADAAPRLIFADAEFAQKGGCQMDITVRLEALDQWIADGTGCGEPAIPQGDDLFSIIYSSGTTGVPKASPIAPVRVPSLSMPVPARASDPTGPAMSPPRPIPISASSA